MTIPVQVQQKKHLNEVWHKKHFNEVWNMFKGQKKIWMLREKVISYEEPNDFRIHRKIKQETQQLLP